ncbi:MAG: hypothetical protein A2020_01185 [Lentisphaerae bacterium GWF2_45_14]|nr:MAG: hypothetical protein A2020_01185 [Lentisphaerae bacterium GWF2_45_14]
MTKRVLSLRFFTLIELFMAIVVVLILIGVLVPRLARAREYARQKYCMNNMSQIALAFQTYIQDNNNDMPPSMYWLTDLSVVYDAAKDLKLYKCPSSTTAYMESPSQMYQRTEAEFTANWKNCDYYLTGTMKDIELRNSIFNEGLGNNAYHFDMSNPGRITQSVVAAKINDERLIYERNYYSHFKSFNVIDIADRHYEVEKNGFTKYWTLDERGWIEISLDAFP